MIISEIQDESSWLRTRATLPASTQPELRRYVEDVYEATTRTSIPDSARKMLYSAYREALEQEWDVDAIPTELAYIEAEAILLALPSWLPAPDVDVEPSGAISLDWHLGRGWSFAVSVPGTGIVYYAGLLGSDTARGSCPFVGRLPSSVKAALLVLQATSWLATEGTENQGDHRDIRLLLKGEGFLHPPLLGRRWPAGLEQPTLLRSAA